MGWAFLLRGCAAPAASLGRWVPSPGLFAPEASASPVLDWVAVSLETKGAMATVVINHS